MSIQQVAPGTRRDPHGWRAGTARVIANALLVLLAFELVSLTAGVAQVIVTGWTPPLPPIQFVLVATVFYLVRWMYVLPGLLPVLVGIEYVAHHAPHARVVTAIVAFTPMALWELTASPGDVPSGQGAILGVTALLFAVLARLPARSPGRGSEDRGEAEHAVGPAIAPR